MRGQGSGATPTVRHAHALETGDWLLLRPRGAVRDLAIGSLLMAKGWDGIATERLARLQAGATEPRRSRRRVRRRFLVTGPMLRAERRAARRALRDLMCLLEHADELEL